MNNRKTPNIIYILADDLGYGDISALNEHSKINTVNIDQLAASGLSYTDAHASSSVCTPSRYSILTGLYNWRSRLKENVLFGYDRPLIDKDVPTVASVLKDAGYTTACIGKWHLGLGWTFLDEENQVVDYSAPISHGPVDLGFDYFYGISASLDMPPYVYIEDNHVTAMPTSISKSDDPKSWWREGPIAPDFKHIEALPKMTQKVLDVIEDHKDEPFFIYYPLPAPHTPILPTVDFVGKSNTNLYGDFVLMCDDVVGQIVQRIEQLGLTDDTIIIFTSDNGCSPQANYSELEVLGHNPSYIYRGTKSDIFEGGHRIPLIVKWPKVIQPSSTTDETVCLIDLMATVVELTHAKPTVIGSKDSVSHLPIWFERDFVSPLRTNTIHHSIDGSFSIRKNQWKLELCPGSGGWSYPKANETDGLPEYQLYDLSNDIEEKTNLYLTYPDISRKLKAELVDVLTADLNEKPWPQLEQLLK